MNPKHLAGFCLGAALALPAAAQIGAPAGSSSSGPTRPQQVSLSGRTSSSGTVTVTQQPAGGSSGGGNSVQTTTTELQVTGNYNGSVPDAPSVPNRVLTIGEAIRLGLKNNLGAKSASQSEQQALAGLTASRSTLLPNISAQFSENVSRVNLAASGFDASAFPGIGQYFPSIVGPFHYYSAQANVSYSPFDLVALNNYAVSKRQGEASRLGSADAREQVVLAVAGTYLRVLQAIALVASEEVQVKYSQGLYDQSSAQEAAGTKAHVEVNRNLVQLQTEKQRLMVDRASLLKQKMALARMIGLPIDEDFRVDEALTPDTQPEIALPDAYNRAVNTRLDLKATQVQLQAAESARKAAGAERLPSFKIQGFYGLQDPNPNTGKVVYNGSAQVNIPIFNGGLIRSDERQADAAVEQHRSELKDMREQVRFDVRTAWIDRDTAVQQTQLADSNRSLAQETLKQSADRYFTGVVTAVEVVQAEQAVAGAERDYIDSLFALNLAKINLARAMGEAEKDIPMVLKGAQ